MDEEKQITPKPQDEHKETHKHNSFVSFFGWIFNWVIVPLLIVVFLHMFVFQPYSVSGSSMEPTLENGNYLIISKLSNTWTNISKIFNQKTQLKLQRGDIVVFRAPNTSNIFFIKRVIGLPKERVYIKNGQVKIFNKDNPQGFVLSEDYIGKQSTEGDIDQIVDADSFFALGDNRKHSGSYDSRFLGPIPLDNVVGNASIRLLPINQINFINLPNYSK